MIHIVNQYMWGNNMSDMNHKFYLGFHKGEGVFLNLTKTGNCVVASFTDAEGCVVAGTGVYTKYSANNVEVAYHEEVQLRDLMDCHKFNIMIDHIFNRPIEIYESTVLVEHIVNMNNPLNP